MQYVLLYKDTNGYANAPQYYVILTLHICTVAFYRFLLTINFNIKTTIMVTSRFLSHYQAVNELIPKLGTVGTVVLTLRPGQFTRVNTQAFIE